MWCNRLHEFYPDFKILEGEEKIKYIYQNFTIANLAKGVFKISNAMCPFTNYIGKYVKKE